MIVIAITIHGGCGARVVTCHIVYRMHKVERRMVKTSVAGIYCMLQNCKVH